MTRIFTEAGESIPVTVIEAWPNRVTTMRTEDRDGYRAVQVTFGEKSPSRLTKSEAGHFERNGVAAGEGLWEFRLGESEGEDLAPGSEIKVDHFEAGQRVNVVGTSKGKGFAGTVKRHNFSMQDATHGNSLSHRVPGSIGKTSRLAAFLRARRCQARWVTCSEPRRTLRSSGSMPKGI